MEIIKQISLYLLVGAVNLFVVEIIMDWTVRKGVKHRGYPWSMEQRVISLLTWPISVSIFWYHFIKAFIETLRKH